YGGTRPAAYVLPARRRRGYCRAQKPQNGANQRRGLAAFARERAEQAVSFGWGNAPAGAVAPAAKSLRGRAAAGRLPGLIYRPNQYGGAVCAGGGCECWLWLQT